jgi:hypothetical protein
VGDIRAAPECILDGDGRELLVLETLQVLDNGVDVGDGGNPAQGRGTAYNTLGSLGTGAALGPIKILSIDGICRYIRR